MCGCDIVPIAINSEKSYISKDWKIITDRN